MSINKTFLPSVQELQDKYASDKNGTYKWLKKSDCFLGNSQSIRMAEHLIILFENERDENEMQYAAPV